MIKKIITWGVLLLLLVGCSAKKTVSMYETRQPHYGEVTIVPMGQQVPAGYKMIGTGSYGDKGLTSTKNCTLESIIELARADAQKYGASLLNIMSVKEPNFWTSTCYQITVAFYIKDEQSTNKQ